MKLGKVADRPAVGGRGAMVFVVHLTVVQDLSYVTPQSSSGIILYGQNDLVGRQNKGGITELKITRIPPLFHATDYRPTSVMKNDSIVGRYCRPTWPLNPLLMTHHQDNSRRESGRIQTLGINVCCRSFILNLFNDYRIARNTTEVQNSGSELPTAWGANL